jgi:hypothetical protein
MMATVRRSTSDEAIPPAEQKGALILRDLALPNQGPAHLAISRSGASKMQGNRRNAIQTTLIPSAATMQVGIDFADASGIHRQGIDGIAGDVVFGSGAVILKHGCYRLASTRSSIIHLLISFRLFLKTFRISCSLPVALAGSRKAWCICSLPPGKNGQVSAASEHTMTT